MTTETLGPTLSASIIGATAGPLTHTIDARWLMAYNAALSDALPRPVGSREWTDSEFAVWKTYSVSP